MAVVLPDFATAANLSNILSNIWPLLIVAIGQTIVLIVGGVDLSQAAAAALAAVIGTALITASAAGGLANSILWHTLINENGGILASYPIGTLAACLAMVAVGSVIGAANGLSVVTLRISPFMVTLVTSTLVGAAATYVTQSENIFNLPASFTDIGGTSGGWLSVSLVIAIVLSLATHFVLTRTVAGRWLYAVGANFQNARISGVPTGRVIVLAYIFSGACAAIGAILFSARLKVGTSAVSTDLLLNVIGAVVIGGTSLFGGKGKVLWTVYGVVFFAVLSNTLNLMNLDYYANFTVKGLVILAAASMDSIRHRYFR
jgi:ribose/xylose/arabinose/galactoside ABC-type transport system permease subunit